MAICTRQNAREDGRDGPDGAQRRCTGATRACCLGTRAVLVPKLPRIACKRPRSHISWSRPAPALALAQPCGLRLCGDRTHNPLAMQKVVGSSPIIRSSSTGPLSGSLVPSACWLRTAGGP
jgi:hypothetical protein